MNHCQKFDYKFTQNGRIIRSSGDLHRCEVSVKMILFVLLFLFPIINYAELSAIVTSETDLNGIEERSSGLTQALGQSFSPLGRCQSTDNGDFGTCMSTRTACTKAGGTVNGYCGTVGFCCSSIT